MRKNGLVAGILLPFFAIFFAFQIVPLIWILVNSFYSQTEEAWGLANYTDILSSPFYLQAIRFSLDISFWSSFYGVIIALIGGYSCTNWGRGVCNASYCHLLI